MYLKTLQGCTSYSNATVVLMVLPILRGKQLGQKIGWVTLPKHNGDLRAKPKGMCIFMKSLIPIAIGNGFSYLQEKIKLYNKLSLSAKTES
ncbi:hypothetical protein SAMN04488007_3520 [Maribacter aquivivus]|uniref:Uncharacterized protein n=1 Tax=Maribacter aquivivus TaxID=228958 RepID=A0A1M6U7E6_9FLAO|nr:hypothetical protein SAMN04488007_3520 [Maribacter aquivivus]